MLICSEKCRIFQRTLWRGPKSSLSPSSAQERQVGERPSILMSPLTSSNEGAATAAALAAEQCFERIRVFERRETPGGTW
jgi:hypothetical protein